MRELDMFRKASDLSSAGQYEASIEIYTELINLNPQKSIYYCMRGYGYSLMQKYQMASDDFRAALKVDPCDKSAVMGLARSLKEIGQYQSAIDVLTESLTVFAKVEDKLEVHSERANCFMNLGQFEQALVDYNYLFAKGVSRALDRAICFEKLGNFEDAIQDITQAIAFNSEERLGKYYANVQGFSYAFRAWCYEQLGKSDLSAPDYTAAEELGFNWAEEYRKSIISCTESIDKDSDVASMLDSRSEAYFRLGQYNLAVDDLTRLITLSPTFGAGIYFATRARCYEKLGQNELSRSDIENAQRLGYKGYFNSP